MFFVNICSTPMHRLTSQYTNINRGWYILYKTGSKVAITDRDFAKTTQYKKF